MSARGLSLGLELAERGLVPERIRRLAIRRQCERHASRLATLSEAEVAREQLAFRDRARRGPIAPVPDLANAQHYEVPIFACSTVHSRTPPKLRFILASDFMLLWTILFTALLLGFLF